MNKELLQIMTNVKELNNVMYKLIDSIMMYENDDQINDILTENYPFELDMFEQLDSMLEWYSSMIEKINSMEVQ